MVSEVNLRLKQVLATISSTIPRKQLIKLIETIQNQNFPFRYSISLLSLSFLGRREVTSSLNLSSFSASLSSHSSMLLQKSSKVRHRGAPGAFPTCYAEVVDLVGPWFIALDYVVINKVKLWWIPTLSSRWSNISYLFLFLFYLFVFALCVFLFFSSTSNWCCIQIFRCGVDWLFGWFRVEELIFNYFGKVFDVFCQIKSFLALRIDWLLSHVIIIFCWLSLGSRHV